MVLRGQYLERPALIDAGGLTLEGLYHRGTLSPALLVCPAPGPGGGMDAPAVAELAWASARAGHPSLRFQHRGAGASGGEPDPSRALEDAEAALAHLRASAAGPVAAAGFAGGCDTALALSAAHPEIRKLVLVAPERLADDPPRAAALIVLPEVGAAAIVACAERWPGARVEIVEHADSAFRRGLPRVGALAVAFLARRG